MFITIIFITILIAWKYSDWKHWEKYQSSMLLFSLGNLLYNFVYHDVFLWKFNPDIFNHHIMEIIYTFTVFPLTTLIFLSTLPKSKKRIILHICKYILIYILVELLLLKTGRIEYRYGWNIWWSLAWDCITFPILVIHFYKPLIAYAICIAIIFIMNHLFPFKLI